MKRVKKRKRKSLDSEKIEARTEEEDKSGISRRQED